MAPTRVKQKMSDEIGRDCRRALVEEKKKKECVERVVNEATSTGVANITPLWRHFSSSKENFRDLDLKAIKAVANISTVHVLDIHGMTVLFPYSIFEQVLELLAPSYIVAINMGEDAGIFDVEHFQLLARKIKDGISTVRRWFVECYPKRRLRMEHLGHNKNPIRKLGQNVRGNTRKNIFYYISGYERLGISMKKAGKAEDA